MVGLDAAGKTTILYKLKLGVGSSGRVRSAFMLIIFTHHFTPPQHHQHPKVAMKSVICVCVFVVKFPTHQCMAYLPTIS